MASAGSRAGQQAGPSPLGGAVRALLLASATVALYLAVVNWRVLEAVIRRALMH